MALNIVQQNGRPYLFALCEDGTLLVIDTIENKTLYKQRIHSDTGMLISFREFNVALHRFKDYRWPYPNPIKIHTMDP